MEAQLLEQLLYIAFIKNNITGIIRCVLIVPIFSINYITENVYKMYDNLHVICLGTSGELKWISGAGSPVSETKSYTCSAQSVPNWQYLTKNNFYAEVTYDQSTGGGNGGHFVNGTAASIY